MASQPPVSPADRPQSERIGKILEIVKSGRLKTIDGLAAEFNLSKSHLQHSFKRQTGLCLGHFILEEKLQLAALLLERSNIPIKRIAYAVGYKHVSSFTRAFERRFAEPPRLYRCHCKPGPKM